MECAVYFTSTQLTYTCNDLLWLVNRYICFLSFSNKAGIKEKIKQR